MNKTECTPDPCEISPVQIRLNQLYARVNEVTGVFDELCDRLLPVRVCVCGDPPSELREEDERCHVSAEINNQIERLNELRDRICRITSELQV